MKQQRIHYWKHEPDADLLDDVIRDWSTLAYGAYCFICDHARRATPPGVLVFDPRRLRDYGRLTVAQWEKENQSILQKFIQTTDGYLHHEGIRNQYVDYLMDLHTRSLQKFDAISKRYSKNPSWKSPARPVFVDPYAKYPLNSHTPVCRCNTCVYRCSQENLNFEPEIQVNSPEYSRILNRTNNHNKVVCTTPPAAPAGAASGGGPTAPTREPLVNLMRRPSPPSAEDPDAEIRANLEALGEQEIFRLRDLVAPTMPGLNSILAAKAVRPLEMPSLRRAMWEQFQREAAGTAGIEAAPEEAQT